MLFLLSLTSLSMVSLTQATCSVTAAKDNVVANRLVGNWTFTGEFSNRLSLDGMNSKVPIGEMIFTYTNDSTVLEKIPDDNCMFLEKKGMTLYMAGTLNIFHIEFGVMEHTYVLTSIYGVPAIIYWQGVNAITNYVQMAPAIVPQNDLLFLGEGSGEAPFGVLERVGTKFSLCGAEDVDKTPRQ